MYGAMKRFYFLLLCVSLAFNLPAATAKRLSNSDQVKIVVEAPPRAMLPHYLREARAFSLHKLDLETKSIIHAAKQWDASDMPLSICFLDKPHNPGLRGRVKKAALKWNIPGSRIKFKFSDDSNDHESITTTMCRGTGEDIRITFKGLVVWSVIATDGRTQSSADPTMTLGGFGRRGLSTEEFDAWVIHEFGHSLGFLHEHQNPRGSCIDDYDIRALTNWLKGKPFYWKQDRISRNLMALEPQTIEGGDKFDPKSIMLYSFPRHFYKEGSKCYNDQNYVLSNIDAATAIEKFPIIPTSPGGAKSRSPFFLPRSVAEREGVDPSIIFQAKIASSDLTDTEKTSAIKTFEQVLARRNNR